MGFFQRAFGWVWPWYVVPQGETPVQQETQMVRAENDRLLGSLQNGCDTIQELGGVNGIRQKRLDETKQIAPVFPIRASSEDDGGAVADLGVEA